MWQILCIFLVFASSGCFFCQTGADALNIPELFTTHNNSGYITETDNNVLQLSLQLNHKIPKKEKKCSENFELIHGRCLYYSNIKKNWIDAHFDCDGRTSILITFKDAKDLMSFLLNLQKSGPTHYQFNMWTGHALFDEKSAFGSLLNDAHVAPMLHKGWATITTCSYLYTIKRATITPLRGLECGSLKYNFLCEQPTL